MGPTEILGRAISIFMLLFVGTFVILTAIALVQAVIPAFANALLFSGLSVGSALVPVAVFYLARTGLGNRPSEGESLLYLRIFLGLVLLLALVFGALMISGRIAIAWGV